MPTIHVDLGSRSYDIQLNYFAADKFTPWLQSLAADRSVCLISDRNVAQHAVPIGVLLEQSGYRVHSVQLEPGEEQKSLQPLSKLYDELAGMKADRKTLVIAMGGGVIGDVAGFAAASFNRGLPLIMIPTTLLSMVDSSVGGKVGINHPVAKNLIGAFHQPRGVWIDPHYLRSLPAREFKSGLAEVVKYGMILDMTFFNWLEQQVEAISQQKQEALEHIIARSCQLKAQVVEQDEHETKGLRAILNFGHTFGHAFEKVSGYGQMLHGEAISIGMVCACRLAERLAMIPHEVTGRVKSLLDRFGLPTEMNGGWSIDDLLLAMRHDKKNVAGQLRFVLPTRIGDVKSDCIADDAMVRQVLEQK